MSEIGDGATWLADVLARRAGHDGQLTVDDAPCGTAADRWTASGLAALTGPSDGAPIAPSRDFAARLEALVRVARAFAGAISDPPASLDMALYSERAADLGLTRRGAIAAGGGARMLRCQDGWAVANLARPEDLDLIDAWIGAPAGPDPWATLAGAAAKLDVQTFIRAGRDLGIPAAVVDEEANEQSLARPGQTDGAPLIQRWGPIAEPRDPSKLLVVDLSGLWAGPLCGRLFAELGARVVKVESTRRPDGARAGSPAFFERMNGAKESAVYDFTTELGQAGLRQLVGQADVVIEASRPRALAHLGIDPRTIARERPNLVWISLTAYGRSGPWSNAVGFGDDCAANAGLLVRDHAGAPLFAGDALADPIAGLMAASAAFCTLAVGGGALIDVALREAARFVSKARAA